MADAPQLKLAVLGDSMAQGLTNGAVTRPEWSYPAIIARACGLRVTTRRQRDDDFVVPSFYDPGIPLDLEALLRKANDRLGPSLETTGEILRFLMFVIDYLDRVEDQYERTGPLGQSFFGPPNHLAISGASVRECRDLTGAECDELITEGEGSLADDFAATASQPLYRIARQVLNASGARERQVWSAVRCFRDLVSKGLANALILHVGNADILDAVAELELRVTPANFRGDRKTREKYNVTHPNVFKRDFEDLADAIRAVIPEDFPVFVGTLPRSTAAPFIRGLGTRKDGYYEAYGHFFVSRPMCGPFSPKTLSGDDARQLDDFIDGYNHAIVEEAAKDPRFHVVDVHGMVKNLAIDDGQDPAEPLRKHVRRLGTAAGGLERLLELDPVPDVRGYRLDANGNRVQGGLFGLDGGHPSTVGYGLVADLFLRAMRAKAGKAIVPDSAAIDWDELISKDACIARGPILWRELLKLAEAHPRLFSALFNRPKASVGAKAQRKRLVTRLSVPRAGQLQPRHLE